MVLVTSALNAVKVKTPKELYKYLLRQCNNLPPDASKFYRHSIKQSFKQHIQESDPDRIKQIMLRSLEDAQWVVRKYTVKPKE